MLSRYFVVLCLSVVYQVSSVENAAPIKLADDVFGAIDIDAYDMSRLPWTGEQRSEINKLNDFLIDTTRSVDPKENMDILLDELKSDLKRGVPYDDPGVQAKRLLLALTTLTGEKECSYYGYLILSNNISAIQSTPRAVVNGEGARRIDNVFAYYMNKHIKNCRESYLKKFDEIYKNLDRDLIARLDKFLGHAVERLTSDQVEKNVGKSYVTRLFDAAEDRIMSTSQITIAYIYNAMVNSVKGTPDETSLQRVSREESLLTGRPIPDRKKFDKIFYGTVAEPCASFREKLGPDVFEPLLLDIVYSHQLQEDRPDFYEAMLKYQLCHFDYPVKLMLERVADYVIFGY